MIATLNPTLGSCPKIQFFRTYSDLNREAKVYQRNSATDFLLSLTMLLSSESVKVETRNKVNTEIRSVQYNKTFNPQRAEFKK